MFFYWAENLIVLCEPFVVWFVQIQWSCHQISFLNSKWPWFGVLAEMITLEQDGTRQSTEFLLAVVMFILLLFACHV